MDRIMSDRLDAWLTSEPSWRIPSDCDATCRMCNPDYEEPKDQYEGTIEDDEQE